MNDNRQPPSEGNEILRVLGRLEGTVSAIQSDIAEIKSEAQTDRTDSQESRRRIHEKLGDMSSRIQKAESTVRVVGELVDRQGKDVAAVTAQVASLQPEVEKTAKAVRRWTVRGGAVVTALAAIGGWLWFLAVQHWVAIWRFIDQVIALLAPRG